MQQMLIQGIEPRAREESSVVSVSQAYSSQAKYWLEAAYEEAKMENEQDDEVKTMAKYIDYIVGKQWKGPRPSYKSRPVDNRIWRLFWELVGILTDIRPLFEIKALNKLYDDHARILNQTTRSWWMEADADLTLAQIVIYALLCTGYGKLEWNPLIRNGEGDFDFIAISPLDAMPLKATTSVDSAQAFIYQKVMPLQWFRKKFQLTGHAVKSDVRFSRYNLEAQNPAHVPKMVFDLLSPAMQRTIGKPAQANDSYYPMALYREFWLRDYQVNTSNVSVKMGPLGANWAYEVSPGGDLYPRGRLMCMGGTELLYDGPNPYWHGRFPFEALRMNIVPWQFHGLSELRPLMDLQDIVNNILAGVIDMVKKAVNPNFIAPRNAFTDAVWNSMDWSMPGAKAMYNPGSPHPPQWAPAPTLPSFVLQIMTLASREMDESSGIATVAEAVRKAQVPAADTLESIKQTQQTPIRLKGRNIEVFLRKFGSMNISNTFQFYSAKRRMFMLGQDGLTFQDFDWEPGSMVPAGTKAMDHARNFAFLIHPGTLMNVAQQEKAQTMMMLRKMGEISRKTLVTHLDLGINAEKEEAALQDEHAKTMAQEIKAKQVMQGILGAGGMQQ